MLLLRALLMCPLRLHLERTITNQATTAMSETSRRTHEAVQDPVIRSLAIASGSSKVARGWLGVRRKRKSKATPQDTIAS